MLIFALFKPLNIKKQSFDDVPVFELTSFIIYEINTIGLDSIILGTKAIRYSDRYTISNINYTDNSQKYIANIKANSGIYKNDIVNLKGDVVYTREDGLNFESDTAKYDKKTSIVSTKSKYRAYNQDHLIVGSSLKYNNILNKIKSKNVISTYQLREK